MKPSRRLMDECRRVMGDFHRFWEGQIVRSFDWSVVCGHGRFDPGKRNAAYAKQTDIALNFRITGRDANVSQFEFCVAWPDGGWQLLFHHDPDHADWPRHPERHVQFEAPADDSGPPPFATWRIPLADTEPLRLLEYVVAHIRD